MELKCSNGIPFLYRLLNRSNHPASGSEEPSLAAVKSCITKATLSFPYSVLTAFSASDIFPCYKIINVILSENIHENYRNCTKLLMYTSQETRHHILICLLSCIKIIHDYHNSTI